MKYFLSYLFCLLSFTAFAVETETVCESINQDKIKKTVLVSQKPKQKNKGVQE